MNLESRPVVFEDIGRQVLATGTRREPEYFIEQICKYLIIVFQYSVESQKRVSQLSEYWLKKTC